MLIPRLTEMTGTRIGRYKLLERIGEGGMGVVWMAEQEEPVRRRVALKIIKLGMDTKEVVARFEAERQALAMMDHPNIASVFDGGATETGRPYFVMELVKGIPITDYCNANKLSTPDRLRLFTQVCQAVQHAHQKGIIHRDLKPSNILVTVKDDRPLPKVIDFGVAKATQARLTEKTLFTQFHQLIGTPAYMSPEQAGLGSLDVDTRSDIYALGVLLYELLTDRTPFDTQKILERGYDAILRAIREEEPPKPSTRLKTMQAGELTATAQNRQSNPPKLVHLIRGDLDWIVMKTLEKDRTRRYETVNGLAMEIQRHLNCEPVVARPPSNLYRFQRWVRRNKLAFAATGAVVTALVLGLGLSTWEFFEKSRALREESRLREAAQKALTQEAESRAQAETEAAKSRQVAQFLEDMLKGVGPSVALGRDTTMLREIVDKTTERIGTDLKGQPEVQIQLYSTLVQVYADLGRYKEMEKSASETLRLARAHYGDDNLVVADTLVQEGRALMWLRETAEAEHITRDAIAMERKLRGPGSVEEGTALVNLGDILRHEYHDYFLEGASGAAEAAFREGLAIFRKQLGNDNDDVAWSLYALASLLNDEGKVAEAVSVQEEALAIRRKIHGDEYPSTGEDYSQLGNLLVNLSTNRMAEGLNDLRKGLEILKRTEGEGKHYRQVWVESGLAQALARQGQLDEAELHMRTAVTIAQAEVGSDHPDLPLFILGLGDLLQREGKTAEARLQFEAGVKEMRKLAEEGNVPMMNAVAWRLAVSSDAKIRDGQSAVHFAETAVGATNRKNPVFLNTLATAYAATGQFAKAVDVEQEAIGPWLSKQMKQDFTTQLKLYQASDRGCDGRVCVLFDSSVSPPRANISYTPAGGPLASARSVNTHLGWNYWNISVKPDVAMTFDSKSNCWRCSVTMPATITQLDCVFNDGHDLWDNNDHADWHFLAGTNSFTIAATATPASSGPSEQRPPTKYGP
jgi:serine/threonine protein kinase